MKLAVLCLDTLGDLTLRQPLLRGLLDAGREVTVVVRPLCEPLVPLIDPRLGLLSVQLDPYGPIRPDTRERLAEVRDRILALQPDVLVAAAYNRTHVDEWLLRNAGAVTTAGFGGRPAQKVSGQLRELETPDGDASPPLAVPIACPEDMPEPQKNNALLCALLGRALPASEPSLTVPRELLEEAQETLSGLRLQPGRYVFGCPGGTVNNPLKGWPVEGYVALVEHLERRHGLPVLLAGLPAEAPRIQAIVDTARARGVEAHVWTGAGPDIGRLVALVARSRLYLGTDTGPMHFAAALDVPVVALFGGGHWPRFLPGARRAFVATRQIPCFGCGWDCWLEEPACVTTVSTDTFVGALDWILGSGPDDRRVDTGPRLDPLVEGLVRGGLTVRARVREEASRVEAALRGQLAASQAEAMARLEAMEELSEQLAELDRRYRADHTAFLAQIENLHARLVTDRTAFLAQIEDLHARLVESEADRAARLEVIKSQEERLRSILSRRAVRVLRRLKLA